MGRLPAAGVRRDPGGPPESRRARPVRRRLPGGDPQPPRRADPPAPGWLALSGGGLLSATALLIAALFPGLLVLLGSRLAGGLAAPGDGALYRLCLYGLGGAVVYHLALTLLDFARIPWSPLLLAALGALLYALGRFLPRGPERPAGPAEIGWGEGTALFVLIVFTAIALTGWITFGDFIFHWGLKGERFYLARGVDYEYLAREWNWVVHPDYPNLLPEVYAGISLLARRFDPPALMLETCALFALLLAAVREGLRQGGADRFTRQAGLALVALVTGAFGIGYVTAGGADWMLAAGLAAAVPPLLRPADRAGDFQIGAIAAFLSASKIEGVPLAAFLVLVQWGRRAWSERRPALGAALRAGLPVAAVVLPWLGRALHHHLFLPSNAGKVDLARAKIVLGAVWETVRDTGAWHGFMVVAFLSPLLLLSRRARPLAVAVLLQLAFDLYVYFSAPMTDLRYFVLSNFARLGFQLVPAILTAALAVWGEAAQRGVATTTAA